MRLTLSFVTGWLSLRSTPRHSPPCRRRTRRSGRSPLSPPLCVSHVVRRGFESASGYRTPKEVVVTSSRTCRATAIFYRWLQVVVICALSSTSAMDNWWAYKETPDGEGNISLWVEWTPTYTKEAAIDNQTDFSTQCHRL